MIHLHIDPGSTNRNDSRIVDDFSAGMGFSLIMVEKYTGGSMKLANHNPFGTINDEGTFICHHRDGTEVNLLFLNVADIRDTRILVYIVDNQSDSNPYRYVIGHSPMTAFLNAMLNLGKSV